MMSANHYDISFDCYECTHDAVVSISREALSNGKLNCPSCGTDQVYKEFRTIPMIDKVIFNAVINNSDLHLMEQDGDLILALSPIEWMIEAKQTWLILLKAYGTRSKDESEAALDYLEANRAEWSSKNRGADGYVFDKVEAKLRARNGFFRRLFNA